MPQLAALTAFVALTRLMLYSIVLDSQVDMRPVQKMGLIQLDLSHCLGVAEALFVPGALSSLKELWLYEDYDHILDDHGDIVYIEGASEDVKEAAAAKAEELGQVVFGHPSLVEVSGACKSYDLDIPDKSRYWQLCSPPGMHRQIWRKID